MLEALRTHVYDASLACSHCDARELECLNASQRACLGSLLSAIDGCACPGAPRVPGSRNQPAKCGVRRKPEQTLRKTKLL